MEYFAKVMEYGLNSLENSKLKAYFYFLTL